MKRTFLDFFPTPRFLSFSPVGLSISDTHVRFIELVRKGDLYALGRYAEKKLAPGVVISGYIKEKEALTKVLTDLRSEHGLEYVKATLPEEKGYLFRTDIPNVEPHEVRGAIEFKLEENVPISVADAVFDYALIGSDQVGGHDHIDVAVSVVPIKLVDAYTDVLKSAGLSPLSFELESQAIARSVVAEGDRRVYLVVNIEHGKTGLYIVSEEVVQFSSTFNTTERPKDTKGSTRQKGKYQISPEDTMRSDEIKRLHDYWSSKRHRSGDRARNIEKIILCGASATEDGFADYLADVLNTEVEYANVWVNAFSFENYIPKIAKKQSFSFPAAIGLALP